MVVWDFSHQPTVWTSQPHVSTTRQGVVGPSVEKSSMVRQSLRAGSLIGPAPWATEIGFGGMAPSLLQVIFLVWFHCYREGAISKLYDNPHIFDFLDSFSRIWVMEVNSNWSLTMLLAQWGSEQKPAVEKA